MKEEERNQTKVTQNIIIRKGSRYTAV